MEDCGEKWGIAMFMGEYHHSVDEKGRLIIPAKYREILGNHSVMTRGIEHCIYVYPEEAFTHIVNQLETLPFTKKDARGFTRFFMSGATAAELDKQGRVLIPTPLANYAMLDKEVVIVGAMDRLEIWDKQQWQAFMDSAVTSMSDIAEGLFQQVK